MKITRTSIVSGIERTKNIAVTQEQIDSWEAGALIQTVMPHLTTDEREFLITGMTSDEWDQVFHDIGEDDVYDDEPAF